jgi:hypothetical protein
MTMWRSARSLTVSHLTVTSEISQRPLPQDLCLSYRDYNNAWPVARESEMSGLTFGPAARSSWESTSTRVFGVSHVNVAIEILSGLFSSSSH